MDDRTKLMSPRPLGAGSQIDWYNIREVLGMGGLGITYRAQDGKLNREVAIREYLPTSFAVRQVKYRVQPISTEHEKRYAQGLANFLKVAKTLEQFRHDNIIKVHNVIETNNTGYMVMECENGVSLDSIIEQCGTLEQNHQTQIFFPIFKGLQEIHELGFVHRSIKPTNIRIRENGSPVLLDFGSARQTSSHQPMESTALVNQNYMPLEQYSEGYGEQGPWTDIYSLAAIMYQGVRGTKPDEALSRSDYLLRGQPDTVQELLAEANPTYTQVFLSALHAGLTLQPQSRPQSLSRWQFLFEGDLRAYRQAADESSTMPTAATTPIAAATPIAASTPTVATTTPTAATSPTAPTAPTAATTPTAANEETLAAPTDVSLAAAAKFPTHNEAINLPVDKPIVISADEPYDEFDIAPDPLVEEKTTDEEEEEFRRAGILAKPPENHNTGIKSILLGSLIVAVIGVAVGIMYLQTNTTYLRSDNTASNSDSSDSPEKYAAAVSTEEPNTTLLEDSAGSSVNPEIAAATNAVAAISEIKSESVPTEKTSLDGAGENLTAAMPTVYFDKPLPNDPQSDSPRTISQIVESVSQFSPIEGMDDKFWKGKDCSECHNWTRESLCKQGTYYNTNDENSVTRIQHPFDGYFKLALKNWAGNDCG